MVPLRTNAHVRTAPENAVHDSKVVATLPLSPRDHDPHVDQQKQPHCWNPAAQDQWLSDTLIPANMTHEESINSKIEISTYISNLWYNFARISIFLCAAEEAKSFEIIMSRSPGRGRPVRGDRPEGVSVLVRNLPRDTRYVPKHEYWVRQDVVVSLDDGSCNVFFMLLRAS